MKAWGLHHLQILQSLGCERGVWLKQQQSTSYQSNLGVIRGSLPNRSICFVQKSQCKSLCVSMCVELLNSEPHSNIYDDVSCCYYYTQKALKSLLIKRDPFKSIPGFSDITLNAADEILSMQLLYMLYKWLS